MKRSRRVVLTMMGTAAVGAVSMGFVPRRGLRSRHDGGARAGRPALLPRDLWRLRRRAASLPWSWPRPRPRPWSRPWRRLTVVRCSASPVPSATTGARPPRTPGLIFTPSTASATGTSAPIMRSRWTRSNARSKRRPAKSTPCASNWSAARSTTNEYLRRLKIPEAFWPLISESWHRDEASLYGRLDLSFDGRGPAKLLEYNADTPTSIFEAAVFQWTWLEQAIERQHHPRARRPVQFDP